MPTAPRPTYPTTNITPSSGDGGGWTNDIPGPFGSVEWGSSSPYRASQNFEYLRRWMLPVGGEGSLVRADRAQATVADVGTVLADRWLTCTTDEAVDDVTYTLADPGGNGRRHTVSFSRLATDNGDFDFIITDSGPFFVSLAPGEFCTVQSTHVGYVDGNLTSGTGVGELDHEDNLVFGWVRRG